jgi:ABC-type nitrate/sulfonate/bicarbonate transport system substrate-binding protein
LQTLGEAKVCELRALVWFVSSRPLPIWRMLAFMKTSGPFAAIAAALVAAWLGAHPAQAADDASAVPIRIAVNTSGGQGEVPYVINQFQLDKKYGFDVQIVDFSAPGQQFVLVKSDAVDVLPGSFIDLMRQRKAGARIKAFHAFQTYSNRIIVKPDAPSKSFADFKGKKFGHYGTTVLDWLIARVAGRQAFGFDVEKDTSLVPGTPPQLNALLTRGEIDGMLHSAASPSRRS